MDEKKLDRLLGLLEELLDALAGMRAGSPRARPRRKGRAPVRAMGQLRAEVLALGETGDITWARAMEATGMLRHSCRGYLARLCLAGEVARVAPATYRLLPAEPLEVEWTPA